MSRRRSAKQNVDPQRLAFEEARHTVAHLSVFQELLYHVSIEWTEDPALAAAHGWAKVDYQGRITCNRHARGSQDEWVWVLAHCLLHLGFGHLEPDRTGPLDTAHEAAACLAVTRFQQPLRLGAPPDPLPDALPATQEEALAEQWRTVGVPATYHHLGCGGTGGDVLHPAAGTRPHRRRWAELLAVGLAAAATEAVTDAGEARSRGPGELSPDNPWERARGWFVSSYPLLGALAAGFRIVADAELTRSWQISVAAVDAGAGEIYVNPLRGLPEAQCRFVLAHEMLHAALRHGERIAHRDPYLWNVATDFVINGWLVEMGIGELPEEGLYDPQLAGMSSEAVYDRITTDLRRYRKLATLRGRGLGDVLAPGTPRAGEARRASDLDDFYRRALTGGLAYHESTGRGLLPSGLVDEIRVLDHPPLPWDAQLARWFDEHFPVAEKRRSYARASRRQASTPNIPRPGWVHPDETVRRPTFGVVLDTSGSMDRRLLGKALGAIASYATARDVPAARVVFCDAAAYDAGYLPVTEIAGRVRVRGRGGTVLQPGIRLLERAEDFPADGPILVITDAQCDAIRIRREHAFLVPAGARLPFTPRGPVFEIRD